MCTRVEFAMNIMWICSTTIKCYSSMVKFNSQVFMVKNFKERYIFNQIKIGVLWHFLICNLTLAVYFKFCIFCVDFKCLKLEKLKKYQLSSLFCNLIYLIVADDDDDVESKISGVARIAPVCDLQPPFQPSSTPVHLQHRFMVRTLNACSCTMY